MMKQLSYLSLLAAGTALLGCSASRQSFDPQHKYSPKELQKDYSVFRGVLEESHPGLYWFTSKDSMNYYFDEGYHRISDSLTEPQFRNVLSYVTSKIHCGHTSIKYSRQFTKYVDTAKQKVFPLSFKVWPDSLAVIGNLNVNDSILNYGTIVTAIDGRPVRQINDTLLSYVSSDGNSITGKYQTLSNRGSYGSLYRSIIGMGDQITVTYLDANGNEQNTTVPVFNPADVAKLDASDPLAGQPVKAIKDIIPKRPPTPPTKPKVPMMLFRPRSVQIDTSLSSAYVTIHTFARGNKLRPFFRQTFRMLKQRHIQSLVVDVRTNGGGDAGISTLLTKYVIDHKFKIADSLYAVHKSSHYAKYIQLQPFYWSLMQLVTQKRKDGNYHYGYFENHVFHPKKRYHFDGDIYIITGGNSFSATTLFVKALQGQKNVKVVGEETGGGAYGNSAWMIPDVVLPNTKVRFRLPKFRLVMDKNLVKEGRGIIPDIEVSPTRETIRKGVDPKGDIIRRLIIHRNGVARAQQ